ncbi:MAG: FHA domain-containing protein, partial [Candidatus Dormibacteraceae bacterium]
SNDIALSGDQLASRRHALIHFDGVNYVIRDLVSANGTYINGVELRSPTPLSNGDHVGVGEHELIFFSVAENAAEPETMTFHQPMVGDVNPMTVPVPGQADTIEPSGAYMTQGDVLPSGAWETAAVSQQDVEAEVKTTTEASLVETEEVAGDSEMLETVSYEEQAVFAQAPVYAQASVSAEPPEATIIERIELTEESSASVVEEEEVEEEEVAPADIPLAERLRPETDVNEEDMPLPVPQLPEIPAMLSAIKSLDSTTAEMRENLRRAKALEEEAEQLRDLLREATDAITGHDNSVAVLAQRLRVGVADVSNRLNKVIEEVNRADESLSIADMMKLIDDVRNDPRDIYTLGSLARRARELAQFFEMHQHVNQILSECLSTLNDLLSPDLAKPDAG